MKKLYTFCAMALLAIIPLSAQQKTVSVQEPGTLCEQLTQEELTTTTSIKIKGVVCEQDINLLKLMSRDHALTDIDLKEAVWVKKENSSGNVKFFDRNLKKLILTQYPNLDANKDGEISIEEALTVNALDFGHESKEEMGEEEKIYFINGLEEFKNLDTLNLKNQFIKDASPLYRLIKMSALNLGGNDIDQIDLSNMRFLEDLRAYGNHRLTSIDLSYNIELKELYLQSTGIKNIDISMLSKLKLALLNNGELETVNFAGLKSLERIDMVKNKLTTIDASNTPKLKELHANGNAIKNITLAGNPVLERLNVYDNQIETIDLSNCPKLSYLFIFDNKIATLNLGSLPELKQCFVSNNPLKTLDFQVNPLIFSIEAENMPNLEEINLKNNGFNQEAEYIIVYGNPKLKTVRCDKGEEETLLKNIFKNSPGVSIVAE